MILMAAAAFTIYIFPNATASDNLAMVQMFEPDEAAPLPTIFRMIAPADTIDRALRNFVFYEYYFYGFPYFALSALLVLPLQWLGLSTDLPIVMPVLRQFASVLPSILALMLLVFMQDRFRTYRSIALFAFLLTLPAVLHNNFWWHPDGITFLFVTLVLFLLWRDNLTFGKHYLAAAVLCGILTATKLVGVYFFLAVGLTLFLGLYRRKITWRRFLGMAAAFIGVMIVSFVAANPFLLSYWGRKGYWQTLNLQTSLLSEGYGIVYQKGLSAAWPIINQYYGSAIFILVAMGTAVWGAIRGPQRLLHALILAWWLPLTISLLTFSHLKYQYWLPAALPLFSCLILLLPEKIEWRYFHQGYSWVPILSIIVVLGQMVSFVFYDVNTYTERLHRAENNPRIIFYDQAVSSLKPVSERPLLVYFDYRLYVPETMNWTPQTTYDLLDYGFIEENQFDVLLLLEQRIRDYLNPNAIGIDTAEFEQNQIFYRDARDGIITGYHLIYQDTVGLIYVRDDLYTENFDNPKQ
ncbi:MAG: glycosyltransferase family 87 protein [Bellilinea sp.]